jgi:ABC-type transport system involved in multi-copper enzyme maturation permease subunit
VSGGLRAFAVLAVEAALELPRRRLALGIALVVGIAVASANTCTNFSAAGTRFNDQPLDPAVVSGFVAPILFSYQALVVLLVTALLAADHLARPLAEETAVPWLARPVSRAAYAGARLAGALAVAVALGILLLGATTVLLAVRHGVAPGPAVVGAVATGLSAVVVAALAMALSLWMGRTPLTLLISLAVPLQFFANGMGLVLALVHPELSPPGPLAALDRFGPPIGTAVLAAVASWNPHVEAAELIVPVFGQLALWAAGAVALLIVAFRRVEV